MDGLVELEALRAFFRAWEAVEALPAKKGRPGPEVKAAKDALVMRAAAVRGIGRGETVTPAANPAAQDYRNLQQQVAAIPPKDTRGPAKKGEVNITNG